MFKTDKYKIRFQRKTNLRLKKYQGFDTYCYIYYLGSEDKPSVIGVAWLNPKDRYDKLKGKKIALVRALKNFRIDKYERTIIWKAFWKWVESWQIPKIIIQEVE